MSAKEIEYYALGETDAIAQSLLGTRLLRKTEQGLMAGLIVETEAYMGEKDSTAHSFEGKKSTKNGPLYAAPGTIYIYSIYGHYLMNVATQREGIPQGVLIRAVEPTIGEDLMLQNRNKPGFDLTNGPGKFMAAFGIQDMERNFQLFGEGDLDIDLFQPKIPKKIGISARIGVENQGSWAEKPYRFFVEGNPYVTGIRKRDIDLDDYGWR